MVHGNGFPKETAWLAEQLGKAEFVAALKSEYREFMVAHDSDRSLLRFHYHKLNILEKRIEELGIPLREYQTDMMYVPLVRQFITDDEINADLTKGSGVTDGKRRIYEYWQENHSLKDKAKFLKNEYGIGRTFSCLFQEQQEVDRNTTLRGFLMIKVVVIKYRCHGSGSTED